MDDKINWKELLDGQVTFEGAEVVIDQAIKYGTREEVLDLFALLCREFSGPDCAGGGEKGTLDRIARIFESLSPTQRELNDRHILLVDVMMYLGHCDNQPGPPECAPA